MPRQSREASEALVVGLDLGTTEVKAGVFTPEGALRGASAEAYPAAPHPTAPGEQDPDAWWDAAARAVRRATDGHDPASVAAIACVGHGPTLVAVGADDRPVRPAICWHDARSAPQQRELGRLLNLEGFGLGLLPKILWLREHERDSYAKARWFMGSWDYLALRMSGTAATATSPAATETTPDLADRAGLDAARVPPPAPWATSVGTLGPVPARELGLLQGTPVVSGTNDGLGAYVGAGLAAPGQAADAGGSSGGFAVAWHDDVAVPGSLSIAGPVDGTRIFAGAMSATGSALDWLRRDVLRFDGPVETLLEEAATAPAGADGLVFLPYLAGERSPIWDPDARGAFIGLDLRHGRAHMVRAVLEGAACALRHVAAPMLAAGVSVTEMRVCGGTARSPLWNQIKADVTGFPVGVPEVPRTGPLGAGILAAVGAGLHADVGTAMGAMTSLTARLEPAPEHRETYDALFGVYADLYPRLAPAFEGLAPLRRGER